MGAWGLEVAEAGSARELGARAVPAERALLRQRARWLRLPPEGLGLRVRAPAGLLGYWATALPGYWAPGLLGRLAAPCM